MKTSHMGFVLTFSFAMCLNSSVHAAEGELVGTTNDPGSADDRDLKNEIPTEQVIIINNDVFLIRGLIRGLVNDASLDGTWVIITTMPNPGSGIASLDDLKSSPPGGGGKAKPRDISRTFSGTYHITSVIIGAKPRDSAGEYRWDVTGELKEHPRNWSPTASDLIKTNPVFANPGTAIVRYSELAEGFQRFMTVIPIPADWAPFVSAAWPIMSQSAKGDTAQLVAKLHAESNPLLAVGEIHALAEHDVLSAIDFAFTFPPSVKASWIFAAFVSDLSPFVSVADDKIKLHWDDLAKNIGKSSIDKHAYEYYIGIKSSRNPPKSVKYDSSWYVDELTSLSRRSRELSLDAGECARILLPVLRFDFGKEK